MSLSLLVVGMYWLGEVLQVLVWSALCMARNTLQHWGPIEAPPQLQTVQDRTIAQCRPVQCTGRHCATPCCHPTVIPGPSQAPLITNCAGSPDSDNSVNQSRSLSDGVPKNEKVTVTACYSSLLGHQ